MEDVGQLPAQLADDFAAELNAAFPNFLRGAGICLGTDSPYLGPPSPGNPPPPYWPTNPRSWSTPPCRRGTQRLGDGDGDSEKEEDPVGVDGDFEPDECELGEGMDYPLEGDQTPMNAEELTTNGDYPPATWSSSESAADEQLTSGDGGEPSWR